jgi:hypothetical protein
VVFGISYTKKDFAQKSPGAASRNGVVLSGFTSAQVVVVLVAKVKAKWITSTVT